MKTLVTGCAGFIGSHLTYKLLEFYKDEEIKKIVYASSSSVYGDSELQMKEDSLLKPVSLYGVTKLATENLCYWRLLLAVVSAKMLQFHIYQ